MVVAPRRVRAGQVVQVFATILRMEFGRHASINVRVAITQGHQELASTEVMFERPSSRIMQLLVGLVMLVTVACNIFFVLMEKPASKRNYCQSLEKMKLKLADF